MDGLCKIAGVLLAAGDATKAVGCGLQYGCDGRLMKERALAENMQVASSTSFTNVCAMADTVPSLTRLFYSSPVMPDARPKLRVPFVVCMPPLGATL